MPKWGFHIKQMNLGEHQNIHTRYIQHKYAFLHKMLYKLIVSTHSYVMVFDWTVKETRCKKKKNTGYINFTEMVCIGSF